MSLEAIDFVRWRIPLFGVYTYLGRELFLSPLTRRKKAIDPLSDDTLGPPPFSNSLRRNWKARRAAMIILPFAQVSGLQDASRIPPLMHFIVRRDVFGDEMARHHVRQNRVIRG